MNGKRTRMTLCNYSVTKYYLEVKMKNAVNI